MLSQEDNQKFKELVAELQELTASIKDDHRQIEVGAMSRNSEISQNESAWVEIKKTIGSLANQLKAV